MAMPNGFEPLEGELREQYLRCFTEEYWVEGANLRPDGQLSQPYTNRLHATLGRSGRKYLQHLLADHQHVLLPQDDQPITEGTVDPQARGPGKVVKVITEKVVGLPEAAELERVAESGELWMGRGEEAFCVVMPTPDGQAHRYQRRADWYITAENSGIPSGVSLFPLEVDYESSTCAGPYNGDWRNAVRVTGTHGKKGEPDLRPGLREAHPGVSYVNIAKVTVFDSLAAPPPRTRVSFADLFF